MALQPPLHDLNTSGRGAASRCWIDGRTLREVSAIRALARHAWPRGTGHHGSTSCSSATSHSQLASRAANSGSSECGVSGFERPWKRFQVRTRRGIARRSVPRLPRHLLTGAELTRDDLAALLHRASELKESPRASRALQDRIVALVFEKPSTRTRVSFDAGIVELSGHPMILRSDEMQLSRGESVKDTARILSAHVDAVGVRTGPDEVLEELAAEGTIPVFNMLTAGHHPCQALADLMTLHETFGELEGLKLAYVGDGNNVARSLAILGGIAGMEVVVASPDGYTLSDDAGATLVADPAEAVRDARAVYADVWVSMGDEATGDERRRALAPYRVDDDLLDRAAPDAAARPGLPPHPGRRITATGST